MLAAATFSAKSTASGSPTKVEVIVNFTANCTSPTPAGAPGMVRARAIAGSINTGAVQGIGAPKSKASRANQKEKGIISQVKKFHSITIARSGYYPTIALSGSYEQSGSDPGASTNDYRNDHNASVTVQASWNFFEWGKTGVNVAKQRYGKQALLERQRSTQDQVRLAVDKACLDLKVAAASIGTAERGRDQARENWRITDLQYRQQVATTTDVLDSRTLLSQAETNYFRALYGYRIALAELGKVLGRK